MQLAAKADAGESLKGVTLRALPRGFSGTGSNPLRGVGLLAADLLLPLAITDAPIPWSPFILHGLGAGVHVEGFASVDQDWQVQADPYVYAGGEISFLLGYLSSPVQTLTVGANFRLDPVGHKVFQPEEDWRIYFTIGGRSALNALKKLTSHDIFKEISRGEDWF